MSPYRQRHITLNADMRAAILMPYALAALRTVSAVRITSGSKLIDREMRGRWDACSTIEIPLEVDVGPARHRHTVPYELQLWLRDDAMWLLTLTTPDQSSSEGDVLGQLRTRLGNSTSTVVREVAKQWTYIYPPLSGLQLSPADFEALVAAAKG